MNKLNRYLKIHFMDTKLAINKNNATNSNIVIYEYMIKDFESVHEI